MAKDEKVSAEQVVRDIRRQTRRKYSAEEKIRIVLEGLRGEESIAELCRREGINPNMTCESRKKAMTEPTTRRSMSLPSVLLRLEGLAGLAGLIVLYSYFGGDLLPFVLLLLVPDLSMLGYLVNPRLGALTYNTVHTYVVPGVVLALGLLTNTPVMSQIACIWFAHISMDRTIGFGLKYPNSFKETHLQRV